MPITEFTVESAALECLRGLGYEVLFGPEVEPEPACVAQRVYVERRRSSRRRVDGRQ